MPSTNIKHQSSGRTILGSFARTGYATQLLFLCGIITSFVYVSSLVLSTAVYAENGTASDTTLVTLNLTSNISIRTLDSAASSEISALNLELTPTPSGKFVKNTSIVDVATSNATGYTLYMTSNFLDPRTSTPSSPVYTTDMIHNDSNVAYTIPTIDPTASGDSLATTITEADFSAASTTSSPNPYVDRWGYSLNAISITDSSATGSTTPTITPITTPATIDYSPIPAHTGEDTINDTVSTAMEHSYTPVTVGVNVDTNIASGTYSNDLYFTAIANALPTLFTLNFNGNTTDTVTDLPNPMTHSTVAAQYTFTIPSTIPTTSAEGYVLKEWNTKADGTGTAYQPGDNFTIVADSSLIDPGERTLYAIWI